MKQKRIIIIGGGAAGLMASIVAARRGAHVTLVERMQRVGKKLLATGNGRCNLSNTDLDFEHYHGKEPGFVVPALMTCDLDRTLAFFKELGLEYMEEDGKIFPRSEQAGSVLEVLRYEALRLGVNELTETRIGAIKKQGDAFLLTASNGHTFNADAVIIATGGKSAPNLGSNGSGYVLAESLGHTIVEPVPALVQVCLDEDWPKQLQGLKISGRSELLVDGKAAGARSGEILFTDYGVSGPPLLELSREISLGIQAGKSCQLRLDLVTGMPHKEVADLIESRWKTSPHKSLEFSMVGFIHKRLIMVALETAGLKERHGEASENFNKRDAHRLAAALKDWRATCSGTQSWMHSQVTAGGVATCDVDASTLESRLVDGIYFAGEVLDVDGDCGGYNLQWAWSSGFTAAENIVK